ncbi:hypothetical protein GQ464_001270 [Rhodocaloribacter litoris]|nr:hypothetical protein [Rhodocaloribacter litoris]QXD15603.1 hypothetical protein GQ464_001270 [Rhodocaloribacter litoris]
MVRALHHTAERRAREAIARAGQAAPAEGPVAPAVLAGPGEEPGEGGHRV